MKGKEALIGVVGGVVGTVLTLVVCSLSPLGAQSHPDGYFSEIICTGLKVVRPDGQGVVLIGSDEHGGIVHVGGQDGELKVHISTEYGGIVGVGKKGKQLAVGLGVDKHGGGVVMVGKDDKLKGVLGVNEFTGNGEVITWDKNGHLLATLR